MNFVVAYDVSTETKEGEKRLRKVAQVCLNHGQRVQKSVFECRLGELQYAEMIYELRTIIHPRSDSIRIYRVNDFSDKNLQRLGRQLGIDFDSPIIL